MRSVFIGELRDTVNSIKILTVAQNAFMAFFVSPAKVKHT
jgi:hypothetical protein